MGRSGPFFQRCARQLLGFMTPVVAVPGRTEGRVAAAPYGQGSMLPGQRKSVEPKPPRLGVDAQGRQQFVRASPWRDPAAWTVVRKDTIPPLEPRATWAVDETGWLKQAQHSEGVSAQYCGPAGRQANCQVNVELRVSNGRLAAPRGGRLSLSESWIKEPVRCARAGVPEETRFAPKPMPPIRIFTLWLTCTDHPPKRGV